MGDDNWSEEDDQLPKKLQKKLLEQLEKQEQREAAAQAAHANLPLVGGEVAQYTPPTFEEVSDRIKKAWLQVQDLVCDAPDQVKSMAFQWLIDAQSQHFGRM